MAQAGAVLEGYSDDVIEYVTAPTTGIQRTQKFAPTIAEIVAACDARVASVLKQRELDKWAERKRRTAEEKARIGSLAPTFGPNLFVPDDARNYEKLAMRANSDPTRAHFETRVCQDGIRRSGVCVPLSWWEEPAQNGAA